MKKVWIGLSITCILIGILGTAVDLIEGNSLEDTAVVLFVLALFAAFFGWLAWLWRIRSPLKRAGEQAAMAANKVKESNDAYKGLSKSLKLRVWKYQALLRLFQRIFLIIPAKRRQHLKPWQTIQ